MTKKVVLEGCLGDWAKKSYINNLAEKARYGNIVLYAVDTRDIRDDEEEIKEYESFVTFINKRSNAAEYSKIDNVDLVFITAPHEVHCKIAGHWLDGGKLKEDGFIFIEKPLDSSVENIEKLKKKYEDIKKKAFAVDHYISKVRNLIKNLKEKKEEYGNIKKISFKILESSPILESRKETLNEGLILDILPHVLAVLSKIMEAYYEKFELDVKKLEIIDVKTGKYKDAPITGETFAKIIIKTEGIEIESFIGKAVGVCDSKMVGISFEKGLVTADFSSGDLSIEMDSKIEHIGDNLQKNQIDGLLNEIIDKETLDENKFLKFDEGFEIVKVISETRRSAGKPIEYEKSETLNEILIKFEKANKRDRAVDAMEKSNET